MLQIFKFDTLPSAAQKTIMTDFYKSFRQNMHRKTADKLCVAQNHLLFDAFLAVIFVRKSDRFRINFPDSLVADGNFMRISAQIFHHRFWASKRLFSINYPRFFPQTLSDFFRKFRLHFHGFQVDFPYFLMIIDTSVSHKI